MHMGGGGHTPNVGRPRGGPRTSSSVWALGIPYLTLTTRLAFLTPFHRRENGGLERLNHWPGVIERDLGNVETCIQCLAAPDFGSPGTSQAPSSTTLMAWRQKWRLGVNESVALKLEYESSPLESLLKNRSLGLPPAINCWLLGQGGSPRMYISNQLQDEAASAGPGTTLGETLG